MSYKLKHDVVEMGRHRNNGDLRLRIERVVALQAQRGRSQVIAIAEETRILEGIFDHRSDIAKSENKTKNGPQIGPAAGQNNLRVNAADVAWRLWQNGTEHLWWEKDDSWDKKKKRR